MTAQKDLPASRPSTSGQPTRPSLARPHAHSVSTGSLNSQHRVNRRKSSSAAGVNYAAVAAIAKDASPLLFSTSEQEPDALGISSSAGKFSSSAISGTGVNGQHNAFNSINNRSSADNGSAIVDDGPPSSSSSGGDRGSKSIGDKVRARRASEGASRLLKGDKPASSTTGAAAAAVATAAAVAKASAAGELRCETCGKGYKHGSCLTKHLWEHTPQWEVTSKFSISKHQQVQLLEAASVLVAMNQDGTPASLPINSSVIRDSELATATSDSPAASGSSDPIEDDDEEEAADDVSSRTSTPSQSESINATSKPTRFSRPRRQDSYSSVFSRSYQSTSATSFGASSAPNDGFSYYRPWSSHHRPTTSGSSRPGTAFSSDEQADLTAAAESLLSCSLGTPSSGPTHMLGEDVPPVPPLPAKFTTSPNPQMMNGQRFASQAHHHQLASYGRHNGMREIVDEDHDMMTDGEGSSSHAHSHTNSYGYESNGMHLPAHLRGHQAISTSRIEEDEGVFGGMDH